MQVFALLADQLVDQRKRPAPDRETGKCETGAVLDDLRRLLQGDTLVSTHPLLLVNDSDTLIECCRNESLRAVSFQFLAKWSVKQILSEPGGRVYLLKRNELRIAETARQLECR